MSTIAGVLLFFLVAGLVWTFLSPASTLAAAVASLPVGVVSYMIASMLAADIVGEGRFYSVPFGGFRITNNAALLASGVVWWFAWFVFFKGVGWFLSRGRKL